MDLGHGWIPIIKDTNIDLPECVMKGGFKVPYNDEALPICLLSKLVKMHAGHSATTGLLNLLWQWLPRAVQLPIVRLPPDTIYVFVVWSSDSTT